MGYRAWQRPPLASTAHLIVIVLVSAKSSFAHLRASKADNPTDPNLCIAATVLLIGTLQPHRARIAPGVQPCAKRNAGTQCGGVADWEGTIPPGSAIGPSGL
jgi:hypothetical protein